MSISFFIILWWVSVGETFGQTEQPTDRNHAVQQIEWWVQTSQADWMRGSVERINRRLLDAVGNPLNYDDHDAGAMKLSSRPGQFKRINEDGGLILKRATIPSVIKDPRKGRYLMVYMYVEDLYYAVSKDGVEWKSKGKLNIQNERYEADPTLIYDGEKFRLWYGDINWHDVFDIMYTESADFIHWTKPRVVMEGKKNTPERFLGIHPVLYLGKPVDTWTEADHELEGGFAMIYTADNGTNESWQLFAAYSSDGVQWQKANHSIGMHSNLSGDIPTSMYSPTLLYDGEKVTMVYGADRGSKRWQVEMATSENLISWQITNEQLLEASDGWDSDTEICCGHLMYDGDEYKYYYTGWYEGIGLAVAKAIYERNGVFTSEVFDAKELVKWKYAEIEASLPEATQMAVFTRTSVDGAQWSGWEMLEADERIASPQGRYLQYRIELKTESYRVSPILNELRFGFIRPAQTR
ncbi:MAG: hypothetical protein AAFX87_28395 [Bacteroidota bacterium]